MSLSGTALKWDFFIAHAKADEATAELLYDMMASARVFLDSRCLELGDNWDISLPKAQSESRVTVVLISSNTEQAYYEREEVAAAIAMARKKGEAHRVVPIYLDSNAASHDFVPYGLRLKQGLYLSDKLTLSDAANKLLSLLKRLRASSDSPTNDGMSDSGDLRDEGIFHMPPSTWSSPVRSNRLRYKVVAFDLDGTLLRGDNFEFSWEAVWKELAFGKDIQGKLKREYRSRTDLDVSRANRVRAYQDWCEQACAQFTRRGLTRNQLKTIANKLTLTKNCRKALLELKAQEIVTVIISGGINTFLEDVFSDYNEYIDFVFINELYFSSTGVLEGVHATPFDFQGKGEALDIVCKRVGCTPAEVVFVGDHFNDEAIMLKVDRAIAYPPSDTVVTGVSHTSVYEDDLLAILPHVLVE